MIKNTMAYEEANYQVVQKFENFEIRCLSRAICHTSSLQQ